MYICQECRTISSENQDCHECGKIMVEMKDAKKADESTEKADTTDKAIYL